jgi:hypothetical protein
MSPVTVGGLDDQCADRRWLRFVTTQADTAFLAAAAGQWTAGLRKALEG